VSGFAGMVSLDGAPPDTRLLERMAQTLAFRGPDGTHITTKPGAGFCFTFLRTGPAPQCPSQPCSLDGRVWLLGDVRLDGRDDLRRKLEQHGDEIGRDVTDEELVLRAWRRWSEESFPVLIGDYSFALWDAEARQLYCARDLTGARPFFSAQAGNCLYFSNTLNAIRCAPEISGELDHHFIGDFLLQGWCSDPARSAFRDISRLTAGYALHYSSAGLHTRRFISLPIEEPHCFQREEEYVERFRELLEQAVRERLPDGSVAVLMSGGLDSTSVAAIAVEIEKESGSHASLRAHTVDYRPLFDDEEGYYASLAAEHLGIPIDILRGASFFPYEGWSDSKPRMPEPCHEPFFLLNNRQYERVWAHASVALTGFGGDDVLTGQAWPYLVYLLRRLSFGKIGKAFGGYILKHGRIPPLRAGFRARLQRLMGRSEPMPEYPSWLAPAFQEQQHLRDRWLELQQTRKYTHPLHPIGHAGLSSGFWPSVLESDDAAWTDAAVEMRAPFLDQRLLRYLLRLPPVPWCMHKELLRQAMRGLLPEQIRTRLKAPLLGDPLKVRTESGRWSPLGLYEPALGIRMFVDWDHFNAILVDARSSDLWSDLRPVSLNYWLKAVEKGGWIR
jgi:asparagine synthase (glutamine-hydrolysing)